MRRRLNLFFFNPNKHLPYGDVVPTSVLRHVYARLICFIYVALNKLKGWNIFFYVLIDVFVHIMRLIFRARRWWYVGNISLRVRCSGNCLRNLLIFCQNAFAAWQICSVKLKKLFLVAWDDNQQNIVRPDIHQCNFPAEMWPVISIFFVVGK